MMMNDDHMNFKIPDLIILEVLISVDVIFCVQGVDVFSFKLMVSLEGGAICKVEGMNTIADLLL